MRDLAPFPADGQAAAHADRREAWADAADELRRLDVKRGDGPWRSSASLGIADAQRPAYDLRLGYDPGMDALRPLNPEAVMMGSETVAARPG